MDPLGWRLAFGGVRERSKVDELVLRPSCLQSPAPLLAPNYNACVLAGTHLLGLIVRPSSLSFASFPFD